MTLVPKVVLLAALLSTAAAQPEPGFAAIQTVPLDPTKPLYVPTHERVTTTVRFPGEIGAPDGSAAVFTEDAAKQSGEYLVTWQPGDAYFTIAPLKQAGLANLNVPYRGGTYVFYFYPVVDPLKAVASINVAGPQTQDQALRPAPTPVTQPSASAGGVTRQAAAPQSGFVEATPARLVGFLDRLKLIHATPVGRGLAELVRSMNVRVALPKDQYAASPGEWATDGVAGVFPSSVSDSGLFQISLLRAVRDRRLNCIGFVCLVRNTSAQVLAFDVNSFGARAGAEYHVQRISQATPILNPGEQSPAYFIIQLSDGSPLKAENVWRLSVDLVSPRVNPGAAITRSFEKQGGGS